MINILNNKLYEIKYFCFLFVILLSLLNSTPLIAQEKIATVVKVQSNVYAVNSEAEKRLLKLYDTIYLNEEVITNERSNIVIQYLDNSTVILKNKSSIKVTDFILGPAKNLFLGVIDKGSAIIESGKIAKDNNSKMEIKLPNMSLDIRGTRFNIGQKEDGSYDVGLSEDSFGNVGTINVSSADTVKTLFDPKQVVSVNSDQIIERPQTDIEKDELDGVTQDFVDVKIINEEDIQKTLESQLFSGDIVDINNDGQIDLLDVKVIRESIVVTKQETIDFIVENSKEDNINFLSNVLNESDEKNVGQSIDKIFDTKNDLVTGVLTGLSNTGNKFITSSGSEKNNEIKEKIFTQLLSGSEQNEKKSKNIELMSKIITKSDVKSIENIVNIVKTSNASEANSNLSLQILSSVADRQSEESISLENEEQTQVNRLIEEAVASAAANNNAENSALIANVITKSNVETITQVVDNVQTSNASTANSTFSLQILSSVADRQTEESISLENEEQTQVNRLIEEAVAAAAANNNAENSALIANVITKSNVETITQVVDNVQTSNASTANSTFSLQILSSVADRQTEESISLENEEQTQVNRLIEEAVAAAAANNNAENSALIANVITKSNVETITQVVDNIKKNNTQNPNAGLSLEIVTSLELTANNQSITIESNKQTQINRLLEEAIAAAAAEEAIAEEAAATLAAAQAAALAAQQAADLLAQQIADQIALDLLNKAERLQRIADGLIEQCSAATINVIAMNLAQSSAEQEAIETETSATNANEEWVIANNIFINFVSPVTKEEKKNYAIARSNANSSLALANRRLRDAENAQSRVSNATTLAATALTNKTSICANANAAQAAADEALSAASAARTI